MTPTRRSHLAIDTAHARRLQWADLVADGLADGRRTAPRGPWWHKAACGNQPDPDLWAPLSPLARPHPRAAEICDVCLVKADCLIAALLDPAETGVRAGVNETSVSKARSRYAAARARHTTEGATQ